MRGTVKWFKNSRGYGFIACGGGGDVFVHGSQVVGEVHCSLRAGDTVEFDIGRGGRGPQAVNVRKVEAVPRHGSEQTNK